MTETPSSTTIPAQGYPPTAPLPPWWAPPTGEDELDLVDLLRILWKRRWLVVLIAALGTGTAVAYALLSTPIFRAQAVIAPPVQRQNSAASNALSALGGLGMEIAGSFGIGDGGSDANRLEALLKSRRLIERVVMKNNLLQVLFKDKWDQSKKTWIGNKEEEIPDFWDAERLIERIYLVRNDTKNGVIRISFDWNNTDTARDILQHFLTELASIRQEDELRKLQANRNFAEEQIKTSRDPVIIAKLQTLLADQLEKSMMAKSVDQSAYELIDPPAASNRRVKPRRAFVVGMGFVGSLFVASALSFLLEWHKKPRS